MRVSPSNLVLTLAALPITSVSAERVLGAYIFARHGDRTAKVLGDTQLTDLGYQEVYQTGAFYHDRYVAPKSQLQIQGISDSIVNQSQISASAPIDDVLQNSAMGFLQGIYPPVGKSANNTLRNGTTIDSPLGGYQLIPLGTVSSGTDSEDASWLQSANECKKAQVSSNDFYSSSLYRNLLDSTKGFYQSLSPILDSAFPKSEMTYKNAYTVFDYINVAEIHNSTGTTPQLNEISNSTLHQLLTLANSHEYNLAFNASEKVRAIAGSSLAGEVVKGLNKTISSQGKLKLSVQFGSYATFLSYFGLAEMPSVNTNFTGVPDYASSMAWELVTNSTASFPAASDISVRFVFHNGTLTSPDQLTEYPLYGQSSILLPWSEFVDRTNKISVSSDAEWCDVCGNTEGKCAKSASTKSDSGSGSSSSSGSGGGMSLAVAGVIGAMVTLAVILGLEALFLLVGGFRLSKKRPAGSNVETAAVTENKA